MPVSTTLFAFKKGRFAIVNNRARPQVQRRLLCQLLGGLLLTILSSLPADLEAGTRRYRATWRDNPAKSIVIGFEHFSGSSVRIVYDTKDGGRNPANYRYSANPARTVEYHEMRNVFVRINKLQPGTRYYFLVVDDQSVSRRMIFETIHDTPSRPLSIVAGGDSRNNRETLKAANRLVSKLRPHFVLFGGDMTNGDSAQEWKEWLDDWQLTMNSDGRLTPIVPTRGNHERSNRSIYDLFDVAHPDAYYSLSFAGGLLRTYTLNTLFPPGGEQLNWLQRDLARSKEMWKIAQYHHSMRPHTSSKPERDELITYWATLFTKYGVDLVCESDAHTVKQTYPIRPSREPGASQNFIRDDRRGTVYVGEGCWGAPLRINDDAKPWTRASAKFNQFKWIWLDLRQMQVRTVRIDRSSSMAGEENGYLNRFRSPPGFYFWDAENTGDVLRIPRRLPETEPGTVRPGTSAPPNLAGGRQTPVIQSTSRLPVLNRDAANRIRVGFQMPSAGTPFLLIQDESLKSLWRKELSVRGPGPYSELVQLPPLPRGQRLELVVYGGDRIVAKYEVK